MAALWEHQAETRLPAELRIKAHRQETQATALLAEADYVLHYFSAVVAVELVQLVQRQQVQRLATVELE